LILLAVDREDVVALVLALVVDVLQVGAVHLEKREGT
jgi:hypothetical protein